MPQEIPEGVHSSLGEMLGETLDVRLVTSATPQPTRWPRSAEDLDVWVPYAVETLANLNWIRVGYAFEYADPARWAMSLRRETKIGVSLISGGLRSALPFPTLHRNPRGEWMDGRLAGRILSESGVAPTPEAVGRLLGLTTLCALSAPLVTPLGLSSVLTLHTAQFEREQVVAHVQLPSSTVAPLLRWAEAGFTGPQWDLVHRAGLGGQERAGIVATGQFPDPEALEMLAAFNSSANPEA